ncbi:MAG: SusC/RagA family TonB-linked outer membrane protein, partial [Gemmatimonadaceae bacterium]
SNTSDLLLSRSISSVQGIDSVTQNIGKTSNKGFELQLGTVNVNRGSFRWSTDLNFATNTNKIVDLYGDQRDDIGSGWFIGMPIDVNYGYKFAGIFQESDDIKNSAQPTALPGYVRVVDVNGDGKIDPLDRTFIGSLEPNYTAGLTNTIRFSRFTLSAFVNTVQGVTRSNQLLGTNQVFTDVRRNTVLRTYWTPQTPINNYPSNSNSSNPLAVPFYEDASFIRLKDVSLSYDLPVAVARRLGGESLRLYVNGRNLWTKTEWTGLDPELTAQRNVPLEKIVTGGITVRF